MTNQGSIGAYYHYGVQLLAGGTISNTGTIRGAIVTNFPNAAAIRITGGAGTVTNAGTISSGVAAAVELAAGFANWVIVDPGAVFSGTVDGGNPIGGAAASTLELAAGASAGTLAGLVTGFINFARIAVDSGASWMLTGANTIGSGTTVTDSGALTIATGGTFTDSGALTIAGGTLTDLGALSIGSSGSLSNAGTILGSANYGVALPAGGGVTNQLAASITGAKDGVYLKGRAACRTPARSPELR